MTPAGTRGLQGLESSARPLSSAPWQGHDGRSACPASAGTGCGGVCRPASPVALLRFSSWIWSSENKHSKLLVQPPGALVLIYPGHFWAPSASLFSQTFVMFVQEEVEVIEDPVDTLTSALGNVLEVLSQSAVCPVKAP